MQENSFPDIQKGRKVSLLLASDYAIGVLDEGMLVARMCKMRSDTKGEAVES